LPKPPPDPEARIEFQFRNQKWPEVLEWLADWSAMSLDWQKLPGDYLNLTTRRKYSAREARDLINRHLLARGYTMLCQGEVMSVVEVKGVDPALVPRVTPDELESRDPYEYVKVSFPLDWLVASRAAEELKTLLSPNGKITPLSATNRLEVVDSVINLREVQRRLGREQSAEGEEMLVRKFQLLHTRAVDVRQQILSLLGVEEKTESAPKSPEEMQRRMQMAQMQAQMRQQQQQQGGAAAPQKEEETKVFLVALERENSILANAPPDKMAAIEQAIKAIDVDLDDEHPYRRSVERMHIYRLTTVDPAPLVKTLEEIGSLEPGTRLEIDTANRAIIAYASLPDHVTIRALVDKLDGSARRFHVIALRRLEADYVAGTVQFMMGAKEEKKQPARPRWYSPYEQPEESKTEDQFSVDADIVHNRLLLRANDDELEQVEDLLVKLGEIPSREGDPRTLRVIDAPPGRETDRWLDQLRRAWDGVNPLDVEIRDEQPETPPSSTPQTAPAASQENDKTTRIPRAPVNLAAHLRHGDGPSRRWKASLVSDVDSKGDAAAEDAPAEGDQAERSSSNERSNDETSDPKPAEETQAEPAPTDQRRPSHRQPVPPPESSTPPPVRIVRMPDGRVVISCDDPRALDRLENLMIELPPPRKDYEVFRLKYADATFTAMDLEDFFKEEEDDEGGRRRSWYWDYYDSGDSSDSTMSRLSKRRPLKFIAHVETNSILVQGATHAQLEIIGDLIQNDFDRREPIDSQLIRSSKTFKIRYSQARTISETIKDVYRDLLSSIDKALENNQQKNRAERAYFYDFGDDDTPQKKYQFKGALSVGVDEVSNTLIVSTSPYLMDEIGQLIEHLDEAAKPSTSVEVVHVGKGLSAAGVQQTLAKILTPGGQQAGQPPQDQRPDGDGRRGRRQRGQDGDRGSNERASDNGE
jgi:type II secretory pathway component GspD/PulD (secretin)